VSFGMRIPSMQNYLLFLIPLAATLGLRIAAFMVARDAAGANRPNATMVR
jgi:hypothetical protein